MFRYSEIIEREGHLYVQDPWESSFSEPFRYRQAWPTGVPARDYPDLVGKKVQYHSDGLYMIISSNRGYIQLENKGQTKADPRFLEKEPIPKPRWRKATGVYRDGEWHKY